MFFIPAYILILFALILIDYYAAILIEKSRDKNRKAYLIISILSTCSALFIFKYFNFFNNNVSEIAKFLHLDYPIGALQLILPLGLSFHTFQSLSYVIEVYKKKQKSEHHLGVYTLYVMFYPQLVAGPIERPQNLLHQFYEEHFFECQRVADGLKLMAWGMFKKAVIADRLASFVKVVYDKPQDYQGVSFLVATVFFAFQIYCDFSGYSDIAIGSAQVMGFRLMDNFNRPYSSRSIAEFWKRWHISLSTWFRDYLYIPLGGNRVSKPRWFYNLFITFFVSGLWHGANWTYVVWGTLHGSYMIFGIITRDWRDKIITFVGINKFEKVFRYCQVFTTFILVCFAWIFFRAKDIQDAFYIAGHLFSGTFNYCINIIVNHRQFENGHMGSINLGQGTMNFVIAVFLILVLIIGHSIQKHGSVRHMLASKPVWFRWVAYNGIIISLLYLGLYKKQFIYFQF